MKRILIIILLCCVETVFAQQYPDLPLNKILSEEEQTQIGVNKLSENEKEKLRIIIIEKFLSGYEKGKKDGIEQAAKTIGSQQATPNVIESQIDGDFEGWGGETIEPRSQQPSYAQLGGQKSSREIRKFFGG